VPTSTGEAPLSVLLDAESDAGARDLDTSTVGGKGAQTAQLRRLGFPVPPTGIVTVTAYRLVAADPRVAAVVERIRAGEPVASSEVDEAFLHAELPEHLGAEIERLSVAVGGEGRVAVRSSATIEDLGGTSFAGQYRSLLDIRSGLDAVRAVRLVWASLWHPAPCAYRQAKVLLQHEFSFG
jgi:pyruvate,water dikinase